MKKLYFRYGAMHSGKSMQVIQIAKNYEIQGKRCCILRATPLGSQCEIWSRTGMSAKACSLDNILKMIHIIKEKVSCIVVDEAQFLDIDTIEHLRKLSLEGTPVICYGLKTDWKGHLFPASKRLLELADTVEEVKTTCYFEDCERKATMNFKLSQQGETVEVEKDGDRTYVPACYKCWNERNK